MAGSSRVVRMLRVMSLCSVFLSCPARTAEVSIFILEDSQTGNLCGYLNERDFARAIDYGKRPTFKVFVYKKDKEPNRIQIVIETEDTASYDEYIVSKGRMIHLSRSVDYLTLRARVDQIWAIRTNSVTKVSESWTELTSGKPLTPTDTRSDLFDRRIVLKVQDLPFHALMINSNSEQWTSGKHCVPGNMKGLEGPRVPGRGYGVRNRGR